MKTRLHEILEKHRERLLEEWVVEQGKSGRVQMLMKEGELRQHCREFLTALHSAIQQGGTKDLTSPAWAAAKELLSSVSRSRGAQGFSPGETASFVFSLKRPLFQLLREELGKDAAAFAEEAWLITEILDNLGLHTIEVYQKGREEVIYRQQQEMMELSTPVVKLWDGILALPLIGTLDSSRTQVVMEALLTKIVETGSGVAIIDITGVPTVDTLVAQHLLKTVTAARLMGAECIISGIRPQIAQTIVHLGVNLGDVTTKANLADAFILALGREGIRITKSTAASAQKEKNG